MTYCSDHEEGECPHLSWTQYLQGVYPYCCWRKLFILWITTSPSGSVSVLQACTCVDLSSPASHELGHMWICPVQGEPEDEASTIELPTVLSWFSAQRGDKRQASFIRCSRMDASSSYYYYCSTEELNNLLFLLLAWFLIGHLTALISNSDYGAGTDDFLLVYLIAIHEFLWRFFFTFPNASFIQLKPHLVTLTLVC